MTEAEWNTCSDPEKMLEFVSDKTTKRNLRLFAVACCREIWPLLIDERSKQAVDAAEDYAKGQLSEEEREIFHREAGLAFLAALSPACRIAHAPRTSECAAARAALLTLLPDALKAATRVAFQAANAARRFAGVDFVNGFAHARYSQACLIRELIGNPFEENTLDSE